MDARDTIAVVILLVFAGWLIAIIIGMKVVNSWVYTPIPLTRVLQES
jgi:hypothetical protein